jgi:2-desacetyl-2-hydroxyethyl bacteriochlorophyllide A dehydrogenase
MATSAQLRGKRFWLRAARQLEVEEVAVQEPPPGHIVVEALYSTVSTGTELTLYSGDFPTPSRWADYARYPMCIGYSLCGRVKALGPQTSGVSEGEVVVGFWPHAQYVTVPATSVVGRVPAMVDPKVASTFALGLIAMNGIRLARLELGESVVVYGLGVLGLLTVQMARLSGCRPVIGVDLAAPRRALAKRLGADEVLDGEQVADKVKQLTGGRGADVLFEVTGNPHIIEEEFRVLRRFGRAVMLSSPRGPSQFDFHDFCNSPSITIIGAHTSATPECDTIFSQWTRVRNCELYFRLIAAGELQVAEMITHLFAPAEAPEVYRSLLEDRSGAGFVIFDWSR